MQIVDTFYANIYMGLQESYNGKFTSEHVAFRICKEYCDEVKLGVTFSLTNFIYVDGHEEGFVVGLIQYPRFPKHVDEIRNHAVTLGKKLMVELKQERFSIVYPDETVMYEQCDL